MKTVLIDGEIGYDWWADSGVTAKTVQSQLEGLATGEEVEVSINSPGGSVYEGAVIFNLLRDTAKTHPVSVRINTLAASMASYIALAARTVDKSAKVTVSDNSVMMIHNPWGVLVGDYRDMRREADYFEKLSDMYGSVHSFVSGQETAAIREAMDAETFYVGKEIFDNGFANNFDSIVPTDDGRALPAEDMAIEGRAALIVRAKAASMQTAQKAQKAYAQNKEHYHGDLEKAAALTTMNVFLSSEKTSWQKNGSKPTAAGNGGSASFISGSGKSGGVSMKPEDLQAQDKNCYDAVFALGEKAGIEKERSRVNAHLLLGESAKAFDVATKHIKSGASVQQDDVQAEYLARRMDASQVAARAADDPGPVNTGGGEKEDAERLMAAFEAGFKGKEVF